MNGFPITDGADRVAGRPARAHCSPKFCPSPLEMVQKAARSKFLLVAPKLAAIAQIGRDEAAPDPLGGDQVTGAKGGPRRSLHG
jgi:hypothetical protein